MYIDCGGVSKFCSDGYRDLEYQKNFYKNDWRIAYRRGSFFLGDLLRTSASTYVDPQYPHSFPRYEFHHFKVKEDSLVIQRVVQYHLLSQHLVPHIQLEYGVLLGLGQL